MKRRQTYKSRPTGRPVAWYVLSGVIILALVSILTSYLDETGGGYIIERFVRNSVSR